MISSYFDFYILERKKRGRVLYFMVVSSSSSLHLGSLQIPMALLLPSSKVVPPALRSDDSKSSKFIPTQFAKFHSKEKYNTILKTPTSGHFSTLCKQAHLQEALHYVTDLESQQLKCEPDLISELLQNCVQERDVLFGQQLHARIIKHD